MDLVSRCTMVPALNAPTSFFWGGGFSRSTSLSLRHSTFMNQRLKPARCCARAQWSSSKTTKQSRQDLEGKTVVVVGLGASGRAAAKLALARGAQKVVGLDSKLSVLPLEEDAELAQYVHAGVNEVRTELGPHKLSTLEEASVLVLSPGVPRAQPQVAAALGAGVPALSELAFAAEALPPGMPIGAVTGTNGKSTVTTFTGQLLQAAGVKAFVGGNLGTPLSMAALHCLQFPAQFPPYQAAVVEVSSYQMEFPGSFSPKAAVILNLTPDHLERHGSMEAYGAAKCCLFERMTPSDLAIIPRDSAELRHLAALAGGSATRAWLGGIPGVQLDSQARRAIIRVPTTGGEANLYLSPLKAVGAHNFHNAGTAALLALSLDVGLSEASLQEGIGSLVAPPHRMELVHVDARGVAWINDSKATNVEATAVGVQGIAGRRGIVLLGGRAKAGKDGAGLGFSRLVEALAPHRAVVAFGEAGEAIKKELVQAGLAVECCLAATMVDAVQVAKKIAQEGDTVLLSPACASFDEFNNFEHRGQRFRELSKL